ncbi:hypothetical protein HDU97_000477 [Phlyctochytrium planicorne]|nr:hypothetical protein HDU97_000477 [Phlyctochytrium planicorne]
MDGSEDQFVSVEDLTQTPTIAPSLSDPLEPSQPPPTTALEKSASATETPAIGEVITKPSTAEVPTTAIEDDSDDFGDFGDFAEVQAVPPPASVAASGGDHADEGDFGDFGEFEEVTPAVVPVAPVVEVPAVAVSNKEEEDALAKRLTQTLSRYPLEIQQQALTISSELSSIVPLTLIIPTGFEAGESIPPLVEDYSTEDDNAADTPKIIDPNAKKMDMPNSYYAGEDWFQFWEYVMKEAEYSESMSTRFRWKKSNVRREFLLALGVLPDQLPSEFSEGTESSPARDTGAALSRNSTAYTTTTPGRPSNAAASQDVGFGTVPASFTVNNQPPASTTTDQKVADVLEAKKLCGISEDELRGKSNEELEELIKILALYQLKMQEQANFWLDAKEQLVMDAEMHNKMIASLVQYATQQHLPVGKSKAPPKSTKKKPATTTRR